MEEVNLSDSPIWKTTKGRWVRNLMELPLTETGRIDGLDYAVWINDKKVAEEMDGLGLL